MKMLTYNPFYRIHEKPFKLVTDFGEKGIGVESFNRDELIAMGPEFDEAARRAIISNEPEFI